MENAYHRVFSMASVVGVLLFCACSHLPTPLEPMACKDEAQCLQEDLDALAMARLKGDHAAWVKASIRAYRRSPELALPVVYSLTPNDGDLSEVDRLQATRALMGRINDRAVGHQARRMVRGTLKSRFDHELPHATTGLIDRWMLVAGFDAPRGAALTRVDRPQEAFDPAEAVMTHRGPRPWRAIHNPSNLALTLLSRWTYPTNKQCAHLVTRLSSKTPFQLQIRSSSEFRLWVDEKPFVELRGLDRSLALETTLPGTLAAGEHQVELRTCSQSSSWWFSLHAVDTNGSAQAIEQLAPKPRSNPLSSDFKSFDLDAFVMALPPADWPEPLRRYIGANLLYRSGRPMAAFQALGQPTNAAGLLSLRTIAAGARRSEQRLEAAEALANNFNAPLERIRTLLDLNQADRAARELFRDKQLMARRDPYALAVIDNALNSFGTRLRRLQLWREAEALHPNWLKPLRRQAAILRASRKNEADAIQARINDLAPNYSRQRQQIRKQGTFAEKWAALAEERRIHPLKVSLQMQQINLLNHHGYHERARARAAALRQQNPYTLSPQRWIAKERWIDEGMEGAMPELEKLLELDPAESMGLQAKRYLEIQGGEELKVPLWQRPSEAKLMDLVRRREAYRPRVPASQVMLMDDHLELIQADGSRRQVITMIRWFLDRRTAQRYLKTSVRGGRLQIHHAFLIRADGTRVDPASRRGGQIRFREIGEGATMVLQYEKVLRPSTLIRGLVNGGFWFESGDTWNVQPTLTLATRQERTPKFTRVGPPIDEQTAEEDGIRVWRFSRRNVPPPPSERPVIAPWREQSQVRFSTMEKWDPYVDWVRDLLRESRRVTNTLQAKAVELTKDAASAEEKVERVYAYASRQIQYEQDYARVIEGWEPHLPDQVLDRSYGDCKDKSMLIITLLEAVGIRAEPVLVRTWSLGDVDEELPSSQFNHMIAWLPAQEGIAEGRFLDATAEYLDLDNLRHDVQGTRGLIIAKTDWRFQEIPERPASQEYMHGDLIHLGGQRWEVKLEERGHAASMLRRAGKGERQSKTFEAIASSGLWTGAKVESAQMVDNEAGRLELRMIIEVPEQVLGADGRLALPRIAIDGWKRIFARPNRQYQLRVSGFRQLRLNFRSQAGGFELGGEAIEVNNSNYQGKFSCEDGVCRLEERILRASISPEEYSEMAQAHGSFRQSMVQAQLQMGAQP